MIGCHDLSVHFGPTTALEGVSAMFAPGVLSAVVGPNGGGKTTLLRALAGLQKVSKGKIVCDGPVAYLSQRPETDHRFPMCVEEYVLTGTWRRTGDARRLGRNEFDRAHEALARVGLADKCTQPLEVLSGGQWQRARFARLIVEDAPIVLLDEPLTGIDVPSAELLLALLDQWRNEGRTVVTVLHDLPLVFERFSHVAVMAGRLVASGSPAECLHTGLPSAENTAGGTHMGLSGIGGYTTRTAGTSSSGILAHGGTPAPGVAPITRGGQR
ncbi:metal ABC transporter ATP-binding protein [Pandoraea apista]|uniref:ATP-binding cassette domain-containing protein n=2 Tax=Pandoraea apista TaxID=93218 RepID=A0A5E5P6K5_9BURK|nr:ATP-binding cassette domain-containing protein [Pandoraea apista]RRJ28110.1 ATP-binding cassette domain-containing protein [Pandoraea apista]RRJ73452.1 ATP-binding cassette domain-containing protein [Pandoraea apista]RSD06986.1 ATP-binding cassette domain-containing protein [Pandoraea apista]RSD15309.1 ATP-binding cassette domain-containing protein [Pandoraea apista]RSK80986.1 ATP-binding cassette domain-containing protein [Pandoraea apista]